MALFRKRQPQEPLIVSMSGVRLGQRIVGLVGRDARLFLDAAAKVGITGRACAIAGADTTPDRIEQAAASAGVLVDAVPFESPLPLDAGSFDLAIVDGRSPEEAQADATLLADLARVLRPGGRVLIVVRAPVAPFEGLFGRQSRPPDVSSLIHALTVAGFTAARLIAAHGGNGFVEAVAKGSDPTAAPES
jgi:SAM-dependent methyltransferase